MEPITTDGPQIPLPESRAVVTVTEAGEVLGLCRSSAYDAVARGEIPSIRVGRRILVPTAALRRMLGLDATMESTGAS